jgi:hypothetical protein
LEVFNHAQTGGEDDLPELWRYVENKQWAEVLWRVINHPEKENFTAILLGMAASKPLVNVGSTLYCLSPKLPWGTLLGTVAPSTLVYWYTPFMFEGAIDKVLVGAWERMPALAYLLDFGIIAMSLVCYLRGDDDELLLLLGASQMIKKGCCVK